MLYNYIQSIDKISLFKYIIYSIVIFFITTRIIKPNFLYIIALIISLIVIYYMHDKKKSTLGFINERLEFMMNSIIPKPKYFHLDSDIVVLFYNIQEFRIYNPHSYDNAVKSVDHILHIEQDIELGVYHCAENIDIVKDQKEKALNHLQSVIHSNPHNSVSEGKLKTAVDKLHLYLERHVDKMIDMCNKVYKDRGINIDTKMLYKKGPKANDTGRSDYNPHYNMY